MNYSNKNKVLITFNDGQVMKSSGSSNGEIPLDLGEDMRWLAYTLPSYIRDEGKGMGDIKKIEITIDYEIN